MSDARVDRVVITREEAPEISEWVARNGSRQTVAVLSWQALRGDGGIRQILHRLRAMSAPEAEFLYADLHYLRRPFLEKLFLLLCGARSRRLRDVTGRRVEVTWPAFVSWDIPRAVFEVVTAPVVLLCSYLLVALLQLRKPRPSSGPRSDHVAYIRVHTFKIRFGGTLAHAVGVVDGFRSLGWQVDAISTDPLPVEGAGYRLHEVPLVGWYRNFPEVQDMAHNFKLLWYGWRVLRRSPPGIVYQRHGGFTFAGMALARALGVPFVVEYNSSDSRRAALWGERRFVFLGLLRRIERLHLTRADTLSVVSRELAEEVLEHCPEARDRLIVNPNGVDPRKFHSAIDPELPRLRLGIPPTRMVVGFSGTFTAYQGLEVLGEAVLHLARSGDLEGLHFLFLGDGGIRWKLMEMLSDAPVRDHVSFPGAVPLEQVQDVLSACDVLVSPHAPPAVEGLRFYWSPIKIFEYMALGKPIVASRVGQIAEVLEDGADSILIPPGDAEALAGAIMRLRAEPGLRVRLGETARRRVVAEYTWEKNVGRVLTALHSTTG